jgi:hypothetical protein
LRPKIPGLSENIRVFSIVGRFLEHSRIYYFENAGQREVYLSSADWMPRNFFRRVEIAFPVEQPALRDRIIDEVLPKFLHDRVKARELQPDGSYRLVAPPIRPGLAAVSLRVSRWRVAAAGRCAIAPREEQISQSDGPGDRFEDPSQPVPAPLATHLAESMGKMRRYRNGRCAARKSF